MQKFENNRIKKIVYISLVVVGFASSVMLFAGLSSAVLVRKMDKFWVNIHLPDEFKISTLLILLSSIFMYLALKKAKANQTKKVIRNLLAALALIFGFIFFQFKGWKSYYSGGNAVKSYITYVYGQYGQSYKVYKNDAPINYDGENYILNDSVISKQELNEVKSFLKQICGTDKTFIGSELVMENYNSPYSIFSLKEDFFLENDSNGLKSRGIALSEGQKDELFKFAYGVCNDQPFFMLKGEYGKDFSFSLNGEDLEYSKKKLFFPAIELTDDEKKAISQYVYSRGEKHQIKDGKVFLDGKEVHDFDDYFQLKQGFNIHIKNDYWERTKEELNDSQYAEFYQTSNVSSSFVWALTFIHFLHLILTIGAISIVIFRAKKGYYHSENTAGISAVGVFWHFVGLLWLYLYVFLEYIN